jgi:hypothetical protein
MGGIICFKAGTGILLNDGTSKNIEDVEVGDIVQSWNEITNKVENSKVVKLTQPVHDDMLIIGFSNGVVNENTFDHPYYVKGKGWCSYSPTLTKERYDIDTTLLEAGDNCYYNNNSGIDEVEVSFIKENWGEVQTYIFELDNNHTFFANGILTHNKVFSLGVEDAVTISGSLNISERKSHASMSVGDTVLAASIEGLPDTDIASEFLLWEYTGSITEVITLVTASIESLTPSSHSEWLIVDCDNGRDDTFKITEGHPLLAKSGSVWAFEYAGDIDTTYKLVSSSLEEVSINSITEASSSEDEDFVRFDIEPQDTYFADDILVHN